MLPEGDVEVEEVCSVYMDIVTALIFMFDVFYRYRSNRLG